MFLVKIWGDDGQMLLDATCLSQMLENVKARSFTFGLAGVKDLIIVTPVERNTYTYMLMPLS